MDQNKVYVLVGKSGSGKTSIVKMLKEYGIYEHISTTTRKPRTGEAHGEDYYFVSKEEFEEMDMLEFVEYSGNLYGITESEFERMYAKHPISVIVTELNGVAQIKQAFPEAVEVIFIECGPLKRHNNMISRGDNTESSMKRIKNDFAMDWCKPEVIDHIVKNDGSLLYL